MTVKIISWLVIFILLTFNLTIITYFKTAKPLTDIGVNPQHAIDRGSHEQSVQTLKSVILTSFFTSKKDPQRRRFMQPTFSYMRNFYNTVIFHNLTAIVFHDKLSDEFVSNYTTTNVKFEKVDTIKDLSINDFRFVQQFRFLKMNEFDYVLLVDIADTFFWHDPIKYMKTYSTHSLFSSVGRGTKAAAQWITKLMWSCYGVNHRNDLTQTYTAGLWGGKRETVLCILQCMVNQIYQTAIPEKNCDMAAFNWCVNYEKCAPQHEIFTSAQFANHPFDQHCEDKNRIVIIDKCPNSPEQCVSIQNGQLERKKC